MSYFHDDPSEAAREITPVHCTHGPMCQWCKPTGPPNHFHDDPSEAAREIAAREGWQPDGSYVPCTDCGATDPPHVGPGIPVRRAGVKHLMTCKRVPRLSPEECRKLQDDLIEIERCRRQALASAANYIIGGVA